MAKQTSNPSSRTATQADIGHYVRFYDHRRGWRFGKLLELGRKWAYIEHPSMRNRIKVSVADVEHWESAA